MCCDPSQLPRAGGNIAAHRCPLSMSVIAQACSGPWSNTSGRHGANYSILSSFYSFEKGFTSDFSARQELFVLGAVAVLAPLALPFQYLGYQHAFNVRQRCLTCGHRWRVLIS